MGRNRKSQTAANRFGPALKALLLCLLFGGCGVGYVWQKDEIRRLGEAKQRREVQLQRVMKENELKRQQLATMRTREFLEARIKELNLGLMPADPAQVWRLPEPGGEVPSRAGEAQYAATAERGGSVVQ